MENNTQETVEPIKESLPPASEPQVVPQPPKSSSKLPLIVGVIALVLVCSGAAYAFGSKQLMKNIISTKSSSVTQETPSVEPTATQTPLFTGQLKRIDQNLKIFKQTESDALNFVENNFVYYEAGKFNRGELSGYTRIIAIRPSEGPGSPLVYALATKDFQTYVLDDPESKTIKYLEDSWQSPYTYLDKSKISMVKTFDTELPRNIKLDEQNALYFEDYFIDTVETNNKDKNGNSIYETILDTDFSKFQKLTSPNANLAVYFAPFQGIASGAILDEKSKEIEKLKKQYILGDSEVIASDSTGVPVKYSLTTPSKVMQYISQKAKYDADMKTYEEQTKLFQNKQTTVQPQYPKYIYLPNLGFLSSDIVSTSNNLKYFKDYETAIPGACATSQNTRIVNIKDGELEQIGMVSDRPLFRLKDTSSPIYTLAYQNKMQYYDGSGAEWNDENKNIAKPTLSEYVSQNPLLFVKDYWNRWVALGEYDIMLPGGCGKPVIYLYPTVPTEVTVQFQVPVQFTTEIPTYAGAWQVLAHKDGTLVNLKSQSTECGKIDSQKKGSEYAQNACKTNIYPYLFWAGNVSSQNYPDITKGWVIARSELKGFINDKLIEIGLNSKEKTDFESYWLPEMLAKDTPYYRLSFLQTGELNTLFPMEVTPRPDTIFRIFLDYTPLTIKPKSEIQPQTLNKLIRNGFTLVEWGGLKRI